MVIKIEEMEMDTVMCKEIIDFKYKEIVNKERLNEINALINSNNLIAIIGRPATGKTKMLMNILNFDFNKKGLLVSLETDKEHLLEKLKASNLNIIIEDNSCITLEQIEEIIDKEQIEVLIIDYIQLLEYPNIISENYEENRTNLINRLIKLVNSKNIKLIITSQLSINLNIPHGIEESFQGIIRCNYDE